MAKPLIGITTYNGRSPGGRPVAAVQHTYIRAVAQAGGLPVLLSAVLSETELAELYERLQGVLFTGGGDVAVKYFNGEEHPLLTDVDETRDIAELALLHKVVEGGKPMLAICRGVQVMNVALGGTLHTHIPDQVPNALKHDNEGFSDIIHPVNIDETSRAADIFGETLLHVNSLHHQALRDVAPVLRVVGHAPDGVIEAVEMPGHPYAIGVQWHPEWLTHQPVTQRLFKSFVSAAEQ